MLDNLVDLLFSSIPTSNDRAEKERYRALLRSRLASYGAERAREMKESAVQLAQQRATEWSGIKDRDTDPKWIAKWQEACDIMALLSDLPVDETSSGTSDTAPTPPR